MANIRVALAQLNPTVGDMSDNASKVLNTMTQCEENDVDLAVFPELVLNGYPPEDLVFRRDFIFQTQDALAQTSAYSQEAVSVVGLVERDSEDTYNTAAVLNRGDVIARYNKRILPNFSVFDERRTFSTGKSPLRLFEIAGVRVGIVICEDAWHSSGPMGELARGGAELIAVINSSPFYVARWRDRVNAMNARAHETGCVIVYVNAVGGQDELVFDGGSFIMSPDGSVVSASPQFIENLSIVDVSVERAQGVQPLGLPVTELSQKTRALDHRWPAISSWLEEDDEIYESLVVGLRDYAKKNGFSDVVLGISGGIDSALVACIAVDALGASNVHGIMMSSPFTSQESIDDAAELAKNLKIDQREISIDKLFSEFKVSLGPSFEGRTEDLTEENLQSRIRGNLLMAMSNKFKWMLLATGNKSELATGFCTLYGDTSGGFAPLKDVLKTRVYKLAHRRNERNDKPIPENILTKPPTAELRLDQSDDQTLPPYEILDPIIEGYVEHDEDIETIMNRGFNRDVIVSVVELVDRAEYKRRQLPPGPRITSRAFGKDRRWPITNQFKPES